MFRRCEATEAAALASVHSNATITIAKLQLLDNVGSDDVAVAGQACRPPNQAMYSAAAGGCKVRAVFRWLIPLCAQLLWHRSHFMLQ